MGGFGSGRPRCFGREPVEACRSLDVNRLHKAGCLNNGWWGVWQRTRNGENVASINLRTEADRLRLSYRTPVGDGDWEGVAETIRMERVACCFGGARPYFICLGAVNGKTCGRRVVKLHKRGRYFLCRYCYDLIITYECQREDEFGRAIRRASKIRQRLGGGPRVIDPFPQKPKGMW